MRGGERGEERGGENDNTNYTQNTFHRHKRFLFRYLRNHLQRCRTKLGI